MTRSDAREGERLAVLLETAAGDQVAEIDLVRSRAFRRLAAALRNAAESLKLAVSHRLIGETELLHEPLAAIRERFADHPGEPAYLTLIVERVADALALLPRGTPSSGVCHGICIQ